MKASKVVEGKLEKKLRETRNKTKKKSQGMFKKSRSKVEAWTYAFIVCNG
jgi:hypothetical protein